MKNNGMKIGLWNGILFKRNNMKLLNVYKSNFLVSSFIFKFIHKKAYLYTTRNKLTYGTNTAVHSYKKVLKGECSETNINL